VTDQAIKEQLSQTLKQKMFKSDEQMQVYEQIIDKKETVI